MESKKKDMEEEKSIDSDFSKERSQKKGKNII